MVLTGGVGVARKRGWGGDHFDCLHTYIRFAFRCISLTQSTFSKSFIVYSDCSDAIDCRNAFHVRTRVAQSLKLYFEVDPCGWRHIIPDMRDQRIRRDQLDATCASDGTLPSNRLPHHRINPFPPLNGYPPFSRFNPLFF